MSNPFRNAVGGRYLEGLFYEKLGADKSSAVYTLKERDHEGLPSLYRLYLLENDPTEHRFAIKYLDGWSHWMRLCQCSWFKPIVQEWRHELEVRLRSHALAEIIAVSKDKHNGNSYHANKYLLDGSWKLAGESKRGRPTKDQIKQEAHEIASKAHREADDFNRVFGTPQ